MRLTRRKLLAGAALTGAAALAGCTVEGDKRASTESTAPGQSGERGAGELVESLGALAVRHGKYFGSGFDIEAVDMPEYGRLIRHHARILTTDNSLKFSAIRSHGQEADFVDGDRIVAWGRESGIPVRGHCLIWNEWQPDWLFKETNARREYWLDRHIDEVAGRYAGQLQSWDVVNEPIWPDHGNDGALRGGPWYEAMGADYIARSFIRAGQVDPLAKLVLNEAGAEWVSPRRDLFRKSLINVIERVRDKGGRVDAVGLECHWRPGLRFEPAVLEDFIAKLGEMKLDVYFTEIDVRTDRMSGSISQVDAQVANFYGRLARTALRRPEVKAFITWQLADSRSYMAGETEGPSRRKPRPLPFDEHLKPKLAYYALAEAFREARSRA